MTAMYDRFARDASKEEIRTERKKSKNGEKEESSKAEQLRARPTSPPWQLGTTERREKK